MKIKLSCKNYPDETFTDYNRLKSKIEEYSKMRINGLPVGFIVTNEFESTLVGVLFENGGMINIFPKGYNGTGSYHSKSEKIIEGDFNFIFEGEHSEPAPNSVVTKSAFFKTIIQFTEIDELPNSITWEND